MMDETVRKNLDFARKGLESGDYPYAAEICKSLLQKHPECLDARRILQIASKKIYDERSFLSKLYTQIVSFVSLFCAYGFGKNKRINFIQHGLCLFPRNKIGLILLAQCAFEDKHFETMLFAYEELHLLFPKDTRFTLALGNAYFNLGDYKNAQKVGEELLATAPSNTDALSLVEAASLAQVKSRGD